MKTTPTKLLIAEDPLFASFPPVLGALTSKILAPALTLAATETWDYIDEPRHAALEAAHVAIEKKGLDPETEVDMLIVVDFDRPSFARRMVVYERGQCPTHRFLVSHGKGNSSPRKLFATKFSNRPGSEMMSLGLFVISRDRPSAKFGRSIEIEGLVPGLNHLARPRAIVIHPATYVSYDIIFENLFEEWTPRLGQSRGCPALTQKDFDTLLHGIRSVRAQNGFVLLYAHKTDDKMTELLVQRMADEEANELEPMSWIQKEKKTAEPKALADTDGLQPLDLDALTVSAWPSSAQ